jgi:hypothetical protein
MYQCPHCHRLTISSRMLFFSGMSGMMTCPNCKTVLRQRLSRAHLWLVVPFVVYFVISRYFNPGSLINEALLLVIATAFSLAINAKLVTLSIVSVAPEAA